MGALTNTVVELCDTALQRLPSGELRAEVATVRERAVEPVRIAVAGRVSSGKSTLVNALLRMRVAPTAATECTRVVTWFRWGELDTATVHLRDGTTFPLALTARRALPERIGVDPAKVAYIDVRLYESALRDLSLIDTPGLSSLGEGARGGTEEFLLKRPQDAVARADAMLYVLSTDAREDDRELLSQFRQHSAAIDCSAGNAVAVLTKVDHLGTTVAEAMTNGQRIAERCARQLGISVATVLPVMGLIAETAECGRIDEERARHLRALAALPAEERAKAFRSARRVLDHPGLPLARVVVQDLVERLDALGLHVTAEAVTRGRSGASELTEALRVVSSIDQLRTLVCETFAVSGDPLKANTALSQLHRLQATARDREDRRILAEVLLEGSERLKLLPESRRLRAIEVLDGLANAALSLPDELAQDVRRIARGRRPAEQLGLPESADRTQVEAAAITAAGRWRRFGNDGRRRAPEMRAAQVMSIAYAGLARDARETVGR